MVSFTVQTRCGLNQPCVGLLRGQRRSWVGFELASDVTAGPSVLGMDTYWAIGDLARAAGVTVRTLRYYKGASRDTRGKAVFIGLDVRDEQSAAVAFGRSHGTSYAQIFDPDGKQLLQYADTLPLSAIPSTLLIDPNGLTAARVIGPVTRSTLTRLIGDIYAGH